MLLCFLRSGLEQTKHILVLPVPRIALGKTLGNDSRCRLHLAAKYVPMMAFATWNSLLFFSYDWRLEIVPHTDPCNYDTWDMKKHTNTQMRNETQKTDHMQFHLIARGSSQREWLVAAIGSEGTIVLVRFGFWLSGH